jgi:hypothetical protein
MKRLITILAVLAIVYAMVLPVEAAVRVRGYFRSNGTYVQPHYRSNPDGNFWTEFCLIEKDLAQALIYGCHVRPRPFLKVTSSRSQKSRMS